jgi:undecaprenyl diphosphate synthase
MTEQKKQPVVGVIMDGNSRWAKARGRGASFGHKAGAEAFRRTVEVAHKRGIKSLVAYAFSCDNWKRPLHEVSFLMGLAERYFKDFAGKAFSNDIRIRIVGERNDKRIPAYVRKAIDEVERATESCRGMDLFIAFNYSGKLDYEHMGRGIALHAERDELKPSEVNFDIVRQHLLSKEVPEIDIVIRTSGEQRLSGFFPVQTLYAEFFVLPANWPDFDEAMFDAVLAEYSQRERRFGGRPQQLVAAE